MDAHLGYYQRRVIVDRLWEDVVVPARARGYQRLWFVGISLGGLGSLLLAQHHPDALAGIFTLAPYLGEEGPAREIESAGGLARWTGAPSKDDFRGLWGWLRGYATGEPRPRLWLAYGASDRYAYGHRLFASALPREQVLVTAGKHDWTAWSRLWAEFLSRGAFPERSPPRASRERGRRL